jgi:hypothetical protein
MSIAWQRLPMAMTNWGEPPDLSADGSIKRLQINRRNDRRAGEVGQSLANEQDSAKSLLQSVNGLQISRSLELLRDSP